MLRVQTNEQRLSIIKQLVNMEILDHRVEKGENGSLALNEKFRTSFFVRNRYGIRTDKILEIKPGNHTAKK